MGSDAIEFENITDRALKYPKLEFVIGDHETDYYFHELK